MNSNPYESPAGLGKDCVVDRPARNALAATIRQFLEEQTSAFAFDEALQKFHDSTDPTVRLVAEAMWYHYDDCKDHMVALSKLEWDYFQRLLLLLESDGQIALTTELRWHWTQLAALGCLIALGGCVAVFGWGQHLLAFSIPFGLVSIGISRWRQRIRPAEAYDQLLTPFASFAELNAIYRTTAAFAKKRYPRALAGRRIRSRVAAFGVGLQFYAFWLMLSPIPLLVQTLPRTQTRTHVDLAGQADSPATQSSA